MTAGPGGAAWSGAFPSESPVPNVVRGATYLRHLGGRGLSLVDLRLRYTHN